MTNSQEKVIFCPTIQHTGTWFVLRFLEKLGYQIVLPQKALHSDWVLEREVPVVLHAHIVPFYYKPTPFFKGTFVSYGRDPLEQFVVRKDQLSVSDIKLLCHLYKTIIPIRDPLAAILTREVRGPEIRHFFIVDAYREMIQGLSMCPNVKFFPIDLDYTFKERKSLLEKTVQHCSLEVEQYIHVINDTAKSWQKENPTPENRFHEPYEAGDIDTIRQWLGPKWAEVQYLKNMRSIIYPFLSRLGYGKKKKLIW